MNSDVSHAVRRMEWAVYKIPLLSMGFLMHLILVGHMLHMGQCLGSTSPSIMLRSPRILRTSYFTCSYFSSFKKAEKLAGDRTALVLWLYILQYQNFLATAFTSKGFRRSSTWSMGWPIGVTACRDSKDMRVHQVALEGSLSVGRCLVCW